MTQEIKKLLREHLDELLTRQKNLYANGGEYDVYEPQHNPSTLYKVGNNDKIIECYELFKAHPDLFPIVYRMGKLKNNQAYMEVEKLDTDRAENDWEYIGKKLNIDDPFNIFFYIINDKKNGEVIYRNTIKRLTSEKNALEIFNRWVKLLKAVHKVYNATVDVHSGNFGYDKSGKLKCLDP